MCSLAGHGVGVTHHGCEPGSQGRALRSVASQRFHVKRMDRDVGNRRSSSLAGRVCVTHDFVSPEVPRETSAGPKTAILPAPGLHGPTSGRQHFLLLARTWRDPRIRSRRGRFHVKLSSGNVSR